MNDEFTWGGRESVKPIHDGRGMISWYPLLSIASPLSLHILMHLLMGKEIWTDGWGQRQLCSCSNGSSSEKWNNNEECRFPKIYFTRFYATLYFNSNKWSHFSTDRRDGRLVAGAGLQERGGAHELERCGWPQNNGGGGRVCGGDDGQDGRVDAAAAIRAGRRRGQARRRRVLRAVVGRFDKSLDWLWLASYTSYLIKESL